VLESESNSSVLVKHYGGHEANRKANLFLRAGDTVGCVADLRTGVFRFLINGSTASENTLGFASLKQVDWGGLRPVLSFASGTKLAVNFGSSAFNHYDEKWVKHGCSSVFDFITARQAAVFEEQFRSTAVFREQIEGLRIGSQLGDTLLTNGHWYFQMEIAVVLSKTRGNAVPTCAIGASDAATGTEWTLSYHFSTQEFSLSARGEVHTWVCLQPLPEGSRVNSLGCCIDVDRREMHFFAISGGQRHYLGVGFQGMQFTCGLVPKFTVDGLQEDDRSQDRFGFSAPGVSVKPNWGRTPQAAALMLEQGLDAIPLDAHSIGGNFKRMSLRPLSGRNFLSLSPCTQSRTTAKSTGYFPSLCAAGVHLTAGKYYYEATVISLGGGRRNYRPVLGTEDPEPDVHSNGGKGLVGWADSRFYGDSVSKGVGDDRFSWGLSGCRRILGQDPVENNALRRGSYVRLSPDCTESRGCLGRHDQGLVGKITRMSGLSVSVDYRGDVGGYEASDLTLARRSRDKKSSDIRQWLVSVNPLLKQYSEGFAKHGYENASALLDATEEDIKAAANAIGIRIDHLQTILAALEKKRQSGPVEKMEACLRHNGKDCHKHMHDAKVCNRRHHKLDGHVPPLCTLHGKTLLNDRPLQKWSKGSKIATAVEIIDGTFNIYFAHKHPDPRCSICKGSCRCKAQMFAKKAFSEQRFARWITPAASLHEHCEIELNFGPHFEMEEQWEQAEQQGYLAVCHAPKAELNKKTGRVATKSNRARPDIKKSSISEALLKYTSLEEVIISPKKIGSQAGAGLQGHLSLHFANVNATILELHVSGLDGIKDLSKCLSRHSDWPLKFLALKNCGPHCGREGARILKDGLADHEWLDTLVVENLSLKNDGCQIIVDFARGHSRLTTLDVSGNSIGEGAHGIGKLLGTPDGALLKTLTLDRCELWPTGAKYLADGLKHNTTLSALSIAENEIGEVGVSAIAEALPGGGLRTLVLGKDNSILDEGARKLTNAIVKSSLEMLTLNDSTMSMRTRLDVLLELLRHPTVSPFYVYSPFSSHISSVLPFFLQINTVDMLPVVRVGPTQKRPFIKQPLFFALRAPTKDRNTAFIRFLVSRCAELDSAKDADEDDANVALRWLLEDRWLERADQELKDDESSARTQDGECKPMPASLSSELLHLMIGPSNTTDAGWNGIVSTEKTTFCWTNLKEADGEKVRAKIQIATDVVKCKEHKKLMRSTEIQIRAGRLGRQKTNKKGQRGSEREEHFKMCAQNFDRQAFGGSVEYTTLQLAILLRDEEAAEILLRRSIDTVLELKDELTGKEHLWMKDRGSSDVHIKHPDFCAINFGANGMVASRMAAQRCMDSVLAFLVQQGKLQQKCQPDGSSSEPKWLGVEIQTDAVDNAKNALHDAAAYRLSYLSSGDQTPTPGLHAYLTAVLEFQRKLLDKQAIEVAMTNSRAFRPQQKLSNQIIANGSRLLRQLSRRTKSSADESSALMKPTLQCDKGSRLPLTLQCDKGSRLPLHYACARGNDNVVELLCKHDLDEFQAQVDQMDKDGWTPLALALFSGHLRCAKTLIDLQKGHACLLYSEGNKATASREQMKIPSPYNVALLVWGLAKEKLNHHPEIHIDNTDEAANKDANETMNKDADESVKGTSARGKRRGIETNKLVFQCADEQLSLLNQDLNVQAYRRSFVYRYLLSLQHGLGYILFVVLLICVALSNGAGTPSFDELSSLSLAFGNYIDETLGDQVESAMHTQTLGHVASAADFEDWANGPLIEALWPPGGVSYVGDAAIEQKNYLLGAVRFRQVRAPTRDCADVQRPSWMPRSAIPNGTCFKSVEKAGFSRNETQPNGDARYPLEYTEGPGGTLARISDYILGYHTTFFRRYPASSGFVVDIPANNRTAAAVAIAAVTSTDGDWIDAATRAVFIEFGMYNWNLGILMYVKVSVEFPEVGGAVPNLSTVPIQWPMHGDTFRSFLYMVLEIALFAVFTYFIFQEAKEFVENECSLTKYAKDPWNFVDLLSCFVYAMWVWLRITWWQHTANLKEVESDEFFEFAGTATLFKMQRNMLSVAVLIAELKIVKYARLLPVVGPMIQASVATISSLQVLVFVGFFLMLVFFIAASFHITFAGNVKSFSTLVESFFSMYAVFLGGVDRSELKSEYMFGILGFFVVGILGSLMLTNILIAVVSDVYQQRVHRAQKEWDTEVNSLMSEQLNRILRRRKPYTSSKEASSSETGSRLNRLTTWLNKTAAFGEKTAKRPFGAQSWLDLTTANFMNHVEVDKQDLVWGSVNDVDEDPAFVWKLKDGMLEQIAITQEAAEYSLLGNEKIQRLREKEEDRHLLRKMMHEQDKLSQQITRLQHNQETWSRAQSRFDRSGCPERSKWEVFDPQSQDSIVAHNERE
jgi:hypothetical protein